jgi:hypothetical protein
MWVPRISTPLGLIELTRISQGESAPSTTRGWRHSGCIRKPRQAILNDLEQRPGGRELAARFRSQTKPLYSLVDTTLKHLYNCYKTSL